MELTFQELIHSKALRVTSFQAADNSGFEGHQVLGNETMFFFI